jgi:hypothetical protein
LNAGLTELASLAMLAIPHDGLTMAIPRNRGGTRQRQNFPMLSYPFEAPKPIDWTVKLGLF